MASSLHLSVTLFTTETPRHRDSTFLFFSVPLCLRGFLRFAFLCISVPLRFLLFHNTILLIPSFNTATLKFINKPVLIPLSLRYVSSCAS